MFPNACETTKEKAVCFGVHFFILEKVALSEAQT
jgi:hypothetical protein